MESSWRGVGCCCRKRKTQGQFREANSQDLKGKRGTLSKETGDERCCVPPQEGIGLGVGEKCLRTDTVRWWLPPPPSGEAQISSHIETCRVVRPCPYLGFLNLELRFQGQPTCYFRRLRLAICFLCFCLLHHPWKLQAFCLATQRKPIQEEYLCLKWALCKGAFLYVF